MENVKEVAASVIEKLAEFWKTDFGSVEFESPTLAIGAAALLATALLIKVVLAARKRIYRAYSGQAIPEKFRLPIWLKIARTLPKIVLAAGIGLLLVSLAKPFLPQTKETVTVKSRERVDLIDVSSSMGFPYKHTDKCVGEIARKAHLRFLSMRKGKGDRTSLWVFSDSAYLVEDFTTDDEAYFFQVYDAPYTMAYPQSRFLTEGYGDDERIIAPSDRIKLIDNEGGTDLAEALEAVIQYFDAEGKKEIRGKSVLLMTDAAVNSYPQQELEELQKRRIVPYIIFVQPTFGDNDSQIANSKRLIEQIASFGGKYFRAEDEKEIEKAEREIDRLESAKIKVEKYPGKQPVFQRFLATGSALLALGIIFGLFLELIFPEYP